MNTFREKVRERFKPCSDPGKLVIGGRKREISDSSFSPLKSTCPDRIAYLDGGEGIITESSDLIISIIRTGYLTYKKGIREKVGRRDSLLLGILSSESSIRCSLFRPELDSSPYREFELQIDSGLFMDSGRIKLSKVSNTVRRLEELRLSSELSEDYNVLIDGGLEEEHPLEREFLGNKNVMGLVKNFRLVTERGKDGKKILLERGKDKGLGSWSYNLGNNKVVKLSRGSSFLTLFYGKDESIAAFMSDDPTFRGYPYGLILADRIARISNRERDIIRSKISVMLKDEYKVLEELKENRAHEILDSIY